MVERTQVNLTVDDYSELKNKETNILMLVENPPRGRLDAPMLITKDNMNRKLGKKIGHLWLNAVQDVLDTGVYQCQVMRVSYDYSQSNGGGNLPKDRDGKDPKNNNRFITFDVLIFDGLNLLEFNAYKLRQLEQGVGNEQVSVHWDNVLRSFSVNFSEPVHKKAMYVIIRKTNDTNTPHDVNTAVLLNNLVSLDSLPIKLMYGVDSGDTSDTNPVDTPVSPPSVAVETYDVIIHDGDFDSREYLSVSIEQLEQGFLHGNIRVQKTANGIEIYFD